jgi:adenylate cyclase
MPAIFTAQLAERGSTYQVSNIFFKEVKYIIPDVKYIDLPNEVALKLKNQLNQGKFIIIKKSDVDNRKSPDIPFEAFKIIKPSSIEKIRALEKSRVSQKLSIYASLLTALDIFDFFMIVAKLKSFGFDVLDEKNKENVFLEIINTEKDELISDLERFLQVKDKLDKLLDKHRGVREYFEEIDYCDTKEEVEEVINQYKGSWLS